MNGMKPVLLAWAIIVSAGLYIATFVAPPAHWWSMIQHGLGITLPGGWP